MPKTERAARKRRGKLVKAKLETLVKKIDALRQELHDLESNDAENVLWLLDHCRAKLTEAAECYTEYL